MNNFKNFLIIFLVIIGFLVVALLAVGLSMWPLLLVIWLAVKKHWFLLVGFVFISVLLQTLKYRKRDIFADECKNIQWDEVGSHLNDEEWMEAVHNPSIANTAGKNDFGKTQKLDRDDAIVNTIIGAEGGAKKKR